MRVRTIITNKVWLRGIHGAYLSSSVQNDIYYTDDLGFPQEAPLDALCIVGKLKYPVEYESAAVI